MSRDELAARAEELVRIVEGQGDVPVFAVDQVRRYSRRFDTRFRQKFVAGQVEHGTNLEADNSLAALLDHLEDELLDSWAYLQAMRAKLGV